MQYKLSCCPLFDNMSDSQIKSIIACSKAFVKSFKKDEIIFSQGDIPEYITILLSGKIIIFNYSIDGNKNIINIFDKLGDIFGEVFLFSQNMNYENFAYTEKDCEILFIPKGFLYSQCENACNQHNVIMSNMLSILANKAYFLNQRIQILSCGTLRQKLTKLIAQYTNDDYICVIPFNRGQLSEFLGATRPSVSRELMKMKKDGLIDIRLNKIKILDKKRFFEII